MSEKHRPGVLSGSMLSDAVEKPGGEMEGAASLPMASAERPRTRGECPASRPCPWVGCRYHLYLEVNPRTGRLHLNFPDLEPWELAETCALDAAKTGAMKGGLTLLEIGERMNIALVQVKHLESRALETLGKRWSWQSARESSARLSTSGSPNSSARQQECRDSR